MNVTVYDNNGKLILHFLYNYFCYLVDSDFKSENPKLLLYKFSLEED